MEQQTLNKTIEDIRSDNAELLEAIQHSVIARLENGKTVIAHNLRPQDVITLYSHAIHEFCTRFAKRGGVDKEAEALGVALTIVEAIFKETVDKIIPEDSSLRNTLLYIVNMSNEALQFQEHFALLTLGEEPILNGIDPQMLIAMMFTTLEHSVIKSGMMSKEQVIRVLRHAVDTLEKMC